jgi:hypothetical protein
MKNGASRFASVAISTRPEDTQAQRRSDHNPQTRYRREHAPLPGQMHTSLMSASGSMEVNAVPLLASLDHAAA